MNFQQYSTLKQEDHNLYIKCLKVKLKSITYQITKNGMYGTEKRRQFYQLFKTKPKSTH